MSSINIGQSLGNLPDKMDTVVSPRKTTTDDLEPDTLFLLLQNKRRRDIYRLLRRHDGVLSHSELAEFIAAEENGKSVSQLTSKERKRVYVSLYQGHLPMMADAGVIEFERTGGAVKLTDRADQLEKYLNRNSTDQPIQLNFYHGLVLGVTLSLGVASVIPQPNNMITGLFFLGVAIITGMVFFQSDLDLPV